MFIHPSTNHHIVNRVCWAFCVYLEAVSVYPQLHVMQNTKVIQRPNMVLLSNLLLFEFYSNMVHVDFLLDYRTIHGKLCFCARNFKVPKLCTLDSPGLFMQNLVLVLLLVSVHWIILLFNASRLNGQTIGSPLSLFYLFHISFPLFSAPLSLLFIYFLLFFPSVPLDDSSIDSSTLTNG